jgi:tRNA synthetases class I (I, L, M and V)
MLIDEEPVLISPNYDRGERLVVDHSTHRPREDWSSTSDPSAASHQQPTTNKSWSSSLRTTTGSAPPSKRQFFFFSKTSLALMLIGLSSRACRAFHHPTASRRAFRVVESAGGIRRKAAVGPPPSRTRTIGDRSCMLLSTTPVDASSSSSSKTENEEQIVPYDVLNIRQGLDKSYEPALFESQIYQWWEQSGCFQPDAQALDGSRPRRVVADDSKDNNKNNNQKKPYVLPMPPPNVTGRLHMGHAIFVALQDVLARFHRMRGRPVLWLPGTDHAGIATQLQVEKLLLAEGTSRTQVGREEFLRRTWLYKDEQGGAITEQLRSLGASADWTRERFTMDDDLSKAVIEAFVRLHEKGLVYRGEYMVNWAPLLQTAVSDLEVEYFDEVGKLYYFKYIVEGGTGAGT